MSDELKNAASVVDKAIDGGVGVAKNVLGRFFGVAGAAFAAPLAFVLGSFVDNKTDWWHTVLMWLAN
jgi:hypothetical protein